jgi:serine protease
MVANPEKGDLMIKGSFNDSLAENFKIGIKVDYRIYTFEEIPLDKFIIMEYDVINISAESKPGFYAGYYADWAIQDVRNHRAAFDPETKWVMLFRQMEEI